MLCVRPWKLGAGGAVGRLETGCFRCAKHAPGLGCRIEIEDSEAVGISSIISNLVTVFPRSVLTAIPSELFSSFVNCLTHLTCSFGRSAALEEVVSGRAPRGLGSASGAALSPCAGDTASVPGC